MSLKWLDIDVLSRIVGLYAKAETGCVEDIETSSNSKEVCTLLSTQKKERDSAIYSLNLSQNSIRRITLQEKDFRLLPYLHTLYLQNNQLESLVGIGNIFDISKKIEQDEHGANSEVTLAAINSYQATWSLQDRGVKIQNPGLHLLHLNV